MKARREKPKPEGPNARNERPVSLNPYETTALLEITRWEAKAPNVTSRILGTALAPLTWLTEKIIPEEAILGALDLSNQVAEWLCDTEDVKRDANITEISELMNGDLELSDKLANEVHNWAIGIATAEGAGAGFAGLPGLAIDIPAVITLALRTINKIGICYGYESKTKADKDFILSILNVASANTMKGKTAALLTLKQIEVMIARQTWKSIAQRAAQQKFGKEAAIVAVKELARSIKITITKRKAGQAIPFLGAGIGATVNGWYIKEVGWAARHAFAKRWLIRNQKIIKIDPSK
jgi:hypothetical protein